MKKIVFLLFCIVTFFSCKTPHSKNGQNCCVEASLKSQFVQLNGNEFQLNDTAFFPLMINYVLNWRVVNDTFVLSPHRYYEDKRIAGLQTAAEINERFRAHFEYIREMGFNTIRLCFDRTSGENFYEADGKKIFVKENYAEILRALDTVVRIARENDLKLMLLIKEPVENADLEFFTEKLLQHFCAEPTIFTYDFINEPLYFDKNGKRSKEDVVAIVAGWRAMMTRLAPHQLFTIGFAEPLEVFRWDAQLLDVDFVSFHTYHPLRALNEIYWYSTYIDKPFMIGETALPADNDTVPYEYQRQFLKKSYEFARDCGAIGYGWWEFQEAHGYGWSNFKETCCGDFNVRHTALLNTRDSVVTAKNKYIIYGTPKPAVAEIAYFSDYQPKTKQRPVNYYNMLGYSNFVIHGSVIDGTTEKPVAGAVIRGWNKEWNVGVNTFSDEQGNFTLFSNDKLVHFKISAPGMNAVNFTNKSLEYSATKFAYTHIDSVPNRLLEYQNISYMPFLDTVANTVFVFNPDLFSKAQFETSIAPVYLKPIAIKSVK
ncbi:MAG: carboxypeptidase-like regulatory domain-containing protein [Bacteroidetes bacterium]|nr:carboxypeptidase-like regulatory domain-containing protein [Bacteroidota bacterium]